MVMHHIFIACPLFIVGLMAAQGVPDSSSPLPAEFEVRSTIVDGHKIDYRLVDVSIIVERTWGLRLDAEAKLVIVGAGPSVHYGVGYGTDNRSINAKIPYEELITLVNSLDLSWLASKEFYSTQTSICEMSDVGFSSPVDPELRFVVRVGELRTCVRCAGVLPKNVALPKEVVKFMNQVLHSPTVAKMVSEIGDGPPELAPAAR